MLYMLLFQFLFYSAYTIKTYVHLLLDAAVAFALFESTCYLLVGFVAGDVLLIRLVEVIALRADAILAMPRRKSSAKDRRAVREMERQLREAVPSWRRK